MEQKALFQAVLLPSKGCLGGHVSLSKPLSGQVRRIPYVSQTDRGAAPYTCFDRPGKEQLTID